MSGSTGHSVVRERFSPGWTGALRDALRRREEAAKVIGRPVSISAALERPRPELDGWSPLRPCAWRRHGQPGVD